MTPEQEAMRDLLRDAYNADRSVRIEFLNGEVKEGKLVEFRDLFSLQEPPFGQSAQVRFKGDVELANVVRMKSVA